MNVLTPRASEECRWDLVALGEVMLRLDPGEGRIATTRTFRVWEGGGEYNVARGLRRCFGLRTAVVTALVDNPVGRLVEDLMLQGGVDQSHVGGCPTTASAASVRNGLNFTERGLRRARRRRLLRPRQHGRRPAAPGRRRLGRDLRRRGGTLVPLGRDLRGALRDDRRGRRRGHDGGSPARRRRVLRPQLPALTVEGDRRAGARPRGQPQAGPLWST